MWSFLLGLVPGLLTTVNGITNAIANERIALTNATTEQARISSQERINALVAQRDVLISDSSKSSVDIWMRFFIAVGPAAYLTKIFLYDKVMQSWTHGSTDPLDPNLWMVVTAVVGFYFLYSAASLFRK
jgi:hypothetical protein